VERRRRRCDFRHEATGLTGNAEQQQRLVGASSGVITQTSTYYNGSAATRSVDRRASTPAITRRLSGLGPHEGAVTIGSATTGVVERCRPPTASSARRRARSTPQATATRAITRRPDWLDRRGAAGQRHFALTSASWSHNKGEITLDAAASPTIGAVSSSNSYVGSTLGNVLHLRRRLKGLYKRR